MIKEYKYIKMKEKDNKFKIVKIAKLLKSYIKYYIIDKNILNDYYKETYNYIFELIYEIKVIIFYL